MGIVGLWDLSYRQSNKKCGTISISCYGEWLMPVYSDDKPVIT